MEKIETDNIVLREFKVDDAEEAYQNWAGIKRLADMSDFKVHSSAEETREMIEMGLGDGEGERYTVAVIFKETMELAGFIRIYEISLENKTCKIEFIVGKKWRDAGKEDWFVEAIDNIVSRLFRDGFDVVSYVFYNTEEKGTLAIRIIEKVGFEKEAVLRDRLIDKTTGRKCDKVVYSIFK